MADQQGTGKHPHKDTQEPYPHQRGSSDSNDQSETRKTSDRGSESSDLKEREYRDEHGNIHHHTRTSKEEQGR